MNNLSPFMKLVLVFFCFIALISHGDNQKTSLQNHEIREEYARFSNKLAAELELLLPASSNNANYAVASTGFIRAKCVWPLLLKNLGYSYRLAQGSSAPEPFSYDNARAGSHFLIWGAYPAPNALVRIGIPFEEFKVFIGKYPSNWDGNFALAKIGLSTSGRYFMHYVASRATSYGEPYSSLKAVMDKALEGRQLLIPCAVWPAEEWYDARMAMRYNAMQKTLLARFAEEQRIDSANLQDTIATMGIIRSLDAIPVLAENITICPQVSTNSPGGFVFPAAEALVAIGPAIGDCFARLKATEPLSIEESLWLRIAHELYPEGLEYELFCAAATNDTRAVRLMKALPWRRLTEAEMSSVGGNPR